MTTLDWIIFVLAAFALGFIAGAAVVMWRVLSGTGGVRLPW